MAEIRIIPTAQQYVESFNGAVDIVARERKFLIFLEGPSLETTHRFVAHLLAGGGVQMLAVTSEEVVVGWCDIVQKQREGFRHVGTLGMGILPKYRGQGLGHRLAMDTIRAATEAGMERIELEVFASNERAIALYRKLGFVTEGIKRNARKLDGVYDDNVFMALLMRN
jgi:ribosomal protein S18 acetylase RimI-like enzyme